MSNTITTTATTSPTFTFTSDSDTGFFSSDDQISIVAGGAANKQIDNYKKVHVARRRHAKKLSRPATWTIANMSTTVLTVTIDP